MIELEGRSFGPGNPMFVCEISANHMGKYELAEQLIREAKAIGADAVKFQAFEPHQMAPRKGPRLKDGPWAGLTLYDLYKEAQTPTEWMPQLFELSRAVGLIPFASVFHPDMVGTLEVLNPACYKIASAEAGWDDLLLAIHGTGRQLIISDGAYDPWDAIVRMSRSLNLPAGTAAFAKTPVVLNCVAEYPAHCSRYDFSDQTRYMDHGQKWGLSDHSKAPVTWMTAAALGASVIEAHLMLPGTKPLDYRHSMLPVTFKGHIRVARQAATMAYGETDGGLNREIKPRLRVPLEFARRMLWARDLSVGHKVTRDDMVCLRSPEGIDPGNVGFMIGMVLDKEVKRWEPVLL